jgi:RNA polymerase sigma factor (TIGR02999 family)
MAESPANITQLLVAWGRGDLAALEALTPHVQQELHRLAARYMAGERPGHVLQATALVNEAYVRLVDWKNVEWADRTHFFAAAASIMRRVLVDYARASQSAKRGGGALQVSLSGVENSPVRPGSNVNDSEMAALDDAMRELEQVSPRQSRVIELRYFGGLSLEETAETLQVSVGTVRRDWTLARAWLFRELSRKSAT